MKLEEFIRTAIIHPKDDDVPNSTIYAVVKATHAFSLADYIDFLKLTQDEKAELIRWGESLTFTTIFDKEDGARWFYEAILGETCNNSDYPMLPDYDHVSCTAVFIEKCDITDLSKRTTIIKSVSKHMPDDVIEKVLERCYTC